MKVAIVGGREIDMFAANAVEAYILALPKEDWVISGGALGVDSKAYRTCYETGRPFILFSVDRRGIEGKSDFRERAFARNQRIAEECDRMVAFWNGVSGGTKNAVEAAMRLGKTVEIISL